MRMDILIGTKDRPTEIGLLLQSLRTQTFQAFDIFILDDASGTPLQNYYFLAHLINRLKIEGHGIKFMRNNISFGVSFMRNQMAEWACEVSKNPLLLRIDDDTICEPDFLEKLMEGIEAGYDLVSGITPPIAQPEWKREIKFIEPIVNRVVLDQEGKFLFNGDDCGYGYIESKLLPADHFRSTALYKKEIHTKHDIWYEKNLTKSGFREEELFSFKIILAGMKLAVHTGAIHYHLMTPSGGNRFQNQTMDMQLMNQRMLNTWVKKKFKKHGDFIKKYHEALGIGAEEELKNKDKITNLIYDAGEI